MIVSGHYTRWWPTILDSRWTCSIADYQLILLDQLGESKVQVVADVFVLFFLVYKLVCKEKRFHQ